MFIITCEAAELIRNNPLTDISQVHEKTWRRGTATLVSFRHST